MKASVFLCAFFLAVYSVFAADAPGSKDSPLVRRYEGSEIIFHRHQNFDRLRLTLEPIVFNYGEQKFDPYKHVDVEGAVTTIYYAIPAGVSPLEVIRNYETDLRDHKFEILFQAGGGGLERNKGDNLAAELYGVTPSNTDQDHPELSGITSVDLSKSQYVAARLSRDSGDVYVSVLAIEASWRTAGALKVPEKSTVVRVDICETKPMEQRMVTVTSEEMAGQISATGRVALYGILFDFNKTEVKPESKPTIEQILKLLHADSRLRLLVVGHTDAIGNFESNRTLSQRRAEAVVAELVAGGIDAKRLFPVGVSFAAPVATNTTEESRAKNRRVELVEMVSGE